MNAKGRKSKARKKNVSDARGRAAGLSRDNIRDYLDVLEARARDNGKPRLGHADVKKRYGLK